MAGRRAVTGLLILPGLLSLGTIAISSYIAEQLVYEAPKAIVKTPASQALRFANVTFPSRDDHINLKGWLIPGVLPDGRLTVDRVIVAVHGTRTNRESPGDHLLELTAALARHGFGVLSFDMRGMGESPPAPLSMGALEQRDVLGAVDFLRRGTPPFPELGRPHIIGGLGISMGASTLLLAASREPAIAAVVSDSAYAEVVPLLEREVAKRNVAPIGRVPGVFAPAALVLARLLYGVDFFAARPVATVACLAPRPLFLIHGTADDYVPIANVRQLQAAASSPAGSPGTTWIGPNARHPPGVQKNRAGYVH